MTTAWPTTSNRNEPAGGTRRPPPLRRRYGRLGLDGNPFRIMRNDDVLDRLIDPGMLADAESYLTCEAHVIEVVGQSGWGKSTWLSALRCVGERRLHETWLGHYCPPETDRVALPREPVDRWCLDEAQRIKPARLSAIIKRPARRHFRLVVATHTSIEPLCRGVGADCYTIRLSPPTIDTIERFADTRILAALRDGLSTPRLAPTATDLLDRQTAGNLHLVDEILYEVFQDYVDLGQLPRVIAERDIAAAIQRRASAY